MTMFPEDALSMTAGQDDSPMTLLFFPCAVIFYIALLIRHCRAFFLNKFSL